MSTFGVTIEEIEKVWTHSNADLLEMAQLSSMSYQFVIAKGQFQAGDRVVYFPIDSLLPAALIDTLKLTGKLAGKEKNRIKTVRLRGEISQGVVVAPREVLPPSAEVWSVGQDVTDLLGVTKYELPPIMSMDGRLVKLPPLVNHYDIESADRYPLTLEMYLLDQPVLITEKLEGSHFAASLLPDGEIAISQRSYKIEANEGSKSKHIWHQVAEKAQVGEKLPQIKTFLEAALGKPLEVVTLRGEVIGHGIQKNIYALKEHTVMFFEVEANGEPIHVPLYLEVVEKFGLAHAPVLSYNQPLRAWLAGQKLAHAANGTSQLNPETLREGVVIRPLEEQFDSKIGRVIIKQRSPEYLAATDF